MTLQRTFWETMPLSRYLPKFTKWNVKVKKTKQQPLLPVYLDWAQWKWKRRSYRHELVRVCEHEEKLLCTRQLYLYGSTSQSNFTTSAYLLNNLPLSIITWEGEEWRKMSTFFLYFEDDKRQRQHTYTIIIMISVTDKNISHDDDIGMEGEIRKTRNRFQVSRRKDFWTQIYTGLVNGRLGWMRESSNNISRVVGTRII